MRQPALFLLTFAFTSAFAQEPITEQALRGTWLASDLGSYFITFSPDGELAFQTISKKKLEPEPTSKTGKRGATDQVSHATFLYTRRGAFSFKQPIACTVGQKSGNLMVALDSERCCFSVYRMGKIMVMDDISTSTLGGHFCKSRTLRKDTEACAKASLTC